MPTPSYSFDPTQVAAGGRDYIRSRIGDKDGKPQWFLSDEEIDGYISVFEQDENGGIDEACAQCAEAISAIFTKLADSVAQRNMRLTYTNRASSMMKLAKSIRDSGRAPKDTPPQTGAAFGSMCGPDLSDSGIDLPRGDRYGVSNG